MRKTLGLFAVLCALASGGCATYSSPRLVATAREPLQPEIFGEIQRWEFAKRVQVKLPAELVVAEVQPHGAGAAHDSADERSVQMVEALGEDEATYEDVAPLFVQVAAPWPHFVDFRAAAARQHADLLLVASMSEEVEDKGHALGFVGRLLNLLIVPAFVVPGETDDLKLHLRAAVVDVRNDLVYATFEDHREERIRATAVGEKDAIEEGFDRLYAGSLAKMRRRLAERLKALERAD